MHPHLLLLSILLLGHLSQAESNTLPAGLDAGCQVSATQRPGSCQPRPPGYQLPTPWPQMVLSSPPEGLVSLEVASNGFIEAAHALLLVEPEPLGKSGLLTLAQQVARQVFAQQPSLAWLDLSIYRRQGFGGFGGIAPLLTASIPSKQVTEFVGLSLLEGLSYPRVWFNPDWTIYPDAMPLAMPATANWGGPDSKPTTNPPELPLLRRFGGDKRRAALTFDDAFHPLYAPLLLDLLRRHRARATFFVIGRNAQAYPFFLRDAVLDGHELANHTFHHLRLGELNEAEIYSELSQTNQFIEQLTGRQTTYFRPPGGTADLRIILLAQRLGLTTALWSLNPGDTTNPGAATIFQRLQAGLQPGSIILLHENAPDMLRALPGFLRWALVEGWELTSLARLADPR
jgi:peptidoglycan/xylan/chitin deacetylase (PgdA/CDA1 family)